MVRILTYFFLFLLSLGVSIFTTQNQQTVTVKFLNLESINLQLGLLLVFCAGMGTIIVTAIQVNGRQVSRQTIEPKRSESKKSQTSSSERSNPSRTKSQPVKNKIADFDDEFDDDWG